MRSVGVSIAYASAWEQVTEVAEVWVIEKLVVKFEVGKRQNYVGVLGGNGPSIMRT